MYIIFSAAVLILVKIYHIGADILANPIIDNMW